MAKNKELHTKETAHMSNINCNALNPEKIVTMARSEKSKSLFVQKKINWNINDSPYIILSEDAIGPPSFWDHVMFLGGQ